MKVTGQAWIATGRGGKAVIRIDQEQVELEENALWEWTGKDDGGTGNAVQGKIRVGYAPGQVKTASDKPSTDPSVRLQQNAAWLLVLDVGTDQSAAEGMAAFLKFSGYPVNPAQQVQPPRWQIWLDGFMSPQAAQSVGKSLQSLAPGIVSATPRRKPTDH